MNLLPCSLSNCVDPTELALPVEKNAFATNPDDAGQTQHLPVVAAHLESVFESPNHLFRSQVLS